MSKFVGTGFSSYEKRIYRAAVSQRLRNIGLQALAFLPFKITDSRTHVCAVPLD